MKRAKLMLVIISVLAIVGGALAFKVQKVGSDKYCTTISDIQPPVAPGACPNFLGSAEMSPNPGPICIYYTLTTSDDPEDCYLVTYCPGHACGILQ